MKEKRQVVQKSKEYKASRSANRYAKFAEAHRSQMEEKTTGLKYESGVAVKLAIKTIKSAPKRNPVGTLPSEWKCPYFHKNYCIVKGHRDCRSEDCCLHGKTKEERDAVIVIIREEAIANQVDTNATKGK